MCVGLCTFEFSVFNIKQIIKRFTQEVFLKHFTQGRVIRTKHYLPYII